MRSSRGGRMRLAAPQLFNPFEVLPPSLVRAVLLRLTITQRARCACVCRRWRELVAEPELWLRLDFAGFSSEFRGVYRNVTEAALRDAAARAQGRLETLDAGHLSLQAALPDVVAQNTSLRELRLSTFDRADGALILEQLLRTAPAMVVSMNSLECGYGTARRLLRSEPPWDRLRLPRLRLLWGVDHEPSAHEDAAVSEPMTLPLLSRVEVLGNTNVSFDLPEMNEVVDLALTHRLTALTVDDCYPTTSTVPALARLLSKSDTLTELTIEGSETGPMLLDAVGAELLADALRANATLQHLTLTSVDLWNDLDAAVTLLRSLTGHASLCSLDLSRNAVYNTGTDAQVIGAALGELVAADAPELHSLDLTNCELERRGLGPLMAALPHNAHLCGLKLEGNDMCLAFVKQELVPAVMANTSLDWLELGECWRGDDAEEQAELYAPAERFVEARKDAREAAEALIDAAAAA
jgi:hypothetical protein